MEAIGKGMGDGRKASNGRKRRREWERGEWVRKVQGSGKGVRSGPGRVILYFISSNQLHQPSAVSNLNVSRRSASRLVK